MHHKYKLSGMKLNMKWDKSWPVLQVQIKKSPIRFYMKQHRSCKNLTTEKNRNYNDVKKYSTFEVNVLKL
jgi:hypothetical protein